MDSDKFKLLTTWCTVGLAKCLEQIGVHSWSDAASIASTVSACVASVYTVLLIVEWFVKKRKGGRK